MNILLSAICDWRIIMVKTPIFKGSCTAIVTPFDEHGINFDKMKELINFQYDNGTAGTTRAIMQTEAYTIGENFSLKIANPIRTSRHINA